MNFEDHPDSNNHYAFTIVHHSPFTPIGGVPNVAMIVDSGASYNVIERQLWEVLKQNKVEGVSTKHSKQLYP